MDMSITITADHSAHMNVEQRADLNGWLQSLGIAADECEAFTIGSRRIEARCVQITKLANGQTMVRRFKVTKALSERDRPPTSVLLFMAATT